MASNPIEKIIRDTAGQFSAEYIPQPIKEKSDGCDLPPQMPSLLRVSKLPAIGTKLDCNTNFIPVPIVVPPFVPPLNGPCPEGFTFEAQYAPDVGGTKYITQLPASGGVRPLILHNFTVNDTGINSLTEKILPDLHISIPQVHTNTPAITGEYMYAVTVGQRYTVFIDNSDSSTWSTRGVWYDGTLYKHGQTFLGVTGTTDPKRFAQVANVADNAHVTINNVQRKRVLNYDRAAGGTTLYVEAGGFDLPTTNYNISQFTLNRLVVGADANKETAGNIEFIQSSCGGKLIGEINLNFADLNIPCAQGFSFDAGYTSKPGETITVSGSTVTNTGTVDFVTLIPTVVPGVDSPLPILRVKDSGNVWHEAQVTAVTDSTTITIGTGITSASYTDWYLQRITVGTNDTAPTGGQFQFVKEGDCGGKLIGHIGINAEIPCKIALTGKTLVSAPDVSSKQLTIKNYLATNPSDPYQDTLVKMNVDNSATCSYQLGFSPASPRIEIPDIKIVLKVGTTEVPFQKAYDDKHNVVTYSATLQNPIIVGGGGGTSTNPCPNCTVWS